MAKVGITLQAAIDDEPIEALAPAATLGDGL